MKRSQKKLLKRDPTVCGICWESSKEGTIKCKNCGLQVCFEHSLVDPHFYLGTNLNKIQNSYCEICFEHKFKTPCYKKHETRCEKGTTFKCEECGRYYCLVHGATFNIGIDKKESLCATCARPVLFPEDERKYLEMRKTDMDNKALYVIRKGDGNIKIGTTGGNLPQEYEYEVLVVVPFIGKAIEHVHKKFADYNIEGELFRPEDNLMKYIALLISAVSSAKFIYDNLTYDHLSVYNFDWIKAVYEPILIAVRLEMKDSE